MIWCTMDTSVEKDSKCAKCCVYCDDSECKLRCPNAIKYQDEAEVVESCIMAYEEE